MKKITLELKDKKLDELEKEAQKLREEIAQLRLETKDTNLIVKKRKRLAVILTIIGQKREIEK